MAETFGELTESREREDPGEKPDQSGAGQAGLPKIFDPFPFRRSGRRARRRGRGGSGHPSIRPGDRGGGDAGSAGGLVTRPSELHPAGSGPCCVHPPRDLGASRCSQLRIHRRRSADNRSPPAGVEGTPTWSSA